MKKIKEYISNFLKNDKASKDLLNVMISFIIILSICLFSYSILFEKSDKDPIVIDKQSQALEEEQGISQDEEARLQSILEEVSGVGSVSVMITYETGKESVPAINTKQGSDQKQEDVVMSGNNEQPVIIKEIKPKVKGVIIVAEGANNIVIKNNVINATAAVFDIPTNRISIFTKRQQP